MTAEHEPTSDLVARADLVVTMAELAALLRDLRRREARDRRGPVLSHRKLAARTGWSAGSVGAYLAGVTLPPTERFDELLRHLGARPHEHGALATARDRVDDAYRPARVMADHSTASPGGRPTLPARSLPAVAREFVGRAGALARLDGVLSSTIVPGAVVVTAVAGMGGVGKTTLAVHWGHSVAGQFPSGQLYVNLRGYDPGEPLSLSDALGVLLTGLGTPPAMLPADDAGRLSLYRSLLSGQRILVVLDNARSSAQVTALLPPPPCLAIVTSRDDLAELKANGEVRRIRLDVFAKDEAVALLRRLIGARVDREPEAAGTLAKRCGYLPLALRVLAQLAVDRPDTPLSALVDELDADFHADGLDAFAITDDLRSDLRAVIAWSVRCLPDSAAGALRLLGLVPGTDVDEHGLAALAGVTPEQATELLATLRRAHLVDPWPPGRWSMHDLVRAYARTAAGDLDLAEQGLALRQLLDYYLRAAMAASDVLNHGGGMATIERGVPTSEVHVPHIRDVDDAMAWLRAERGNIVAACVFAARHGFAAHAVAIAVQLWAFFEDADAHDDAITVHTAALAVVDEPGAAHPWDRGRILAALALALFRLGDLENATMRAQEAITASRQASHDRGAILGLSILGAVRGAQGRLEEEIAAFEEVLEIARSEVPTAQIVPLANLAELNLTLERYEVAADYFQQSTRLAAEADLRRDVAEGQRGSAMVLVRLGRCAEAIPLAEQALDVTREYGYPARVVTVLETLALAYQGMGQTARAMDHLAEAVKLCRDLAGTFMAAQVLNALGETYRVAGDHESARASHEEAFELAETARDRKEQARALVGLGDAHVALGDDERGVALWQVALDEYIDMGLPAAARVEARLREAS